MWQNVYNKWTRSLRQIWQYMGSLQYCCDSRAYFISEPIAKQDIETQSVDENNIKQQFVFCIEVWAVQITLLFK